MRSLEIYLEKSHRTLQDVAKDLEFFYMQWEAISWLKQGT